MIKQDDELRYEVKEKDKNVEMQEENNQNVRMRKNNVRQYSNEFLRRLDGEQGQVVKQENSDRGIEEIDISSIRGRPRQESNQQGQSRRTSMQHLEALQKGNVNHAGTMFNGGNQFHADLSLKSQIRNMSLGINNKHRIISLQKMKQLFEIGCKRKCMIHRNVTFSEIEQQCRTINLQKFISFCNYFELFVIFDKGYLIDLFKTHAINRRILDYQRFQMLINKLQQKQNKVTKIFLDKQLFENKMKEKQIYTDRGVKSKLSKYKFKLRPINGMDINTIVTHIQSKKNMRIKMNSNERKVQLASHYKLPELDKAYSKGKIHVMKLANASNASASSKLQMIEVEPVQQFNPERYFQTAQPVNDKLWELYQANIWGRQQCLVSQKLQEVLNRKTRINSKMLQKVAQHSLMS